MCPMCRLILATPEGQQMVAALREGIWILLIAPFGAAIVVATAIVKSRQRLASRLSRAD
ncbi:MAG: hypothetical protein ND807_10560 [Vicinamibacterales bacterium]|nr:hypothetical protein [Vicinamibacterales bacterium]